MGESRIVAVTGAPCSGKSFICNRIMTQVGFEPDMPVHLISTSKIVRELASHDTRIMGMLAMGCMFPSEGLLATNLYRVVYEALRMGESVLIDGLPRFANQVELLQSWSHTCRVLIIHPPAGAMTRYRSSRRTEAGLVAGYPQMDFMDLSRMHLWYGRQLHEVVNKCLELKVPFDFGWGDTEAYNWTLDLTKWLSPLSAA